MSKKMPGIEESMKQLEEILTKMSGNEVTLEEGIALYAQAAGLIKNSSEALAKAELEIKEIDKQLDEVGKAP